MGDAKALQQLATLLGAEHADVCQRITLAIEDPEAYVKTYAKELHERAIASPTPNLPLVALIDALAKHKLLAEIDSGSAAEDAQWALARLATMPKRKTLWSWTKRLDLDDIDAEPFVARAGDELGKHDLALVELDVHSDALPVVLVRKKEARRVVQLARDAGFDAELLGTRKRGAAQSREPSAPVVAKYDDHRFTFAEATWSIVAVHDDVAVLSSRILDRTQWVDLRRWPPKPTPLADRWTRTATCSGDGTWVLLHGWQPQEVLIGKAGKKMRRLALPRKSWGFSAAGIVDGRAVVVPGSMQDGSSRSPNLTQAPRPFIEANGKLVAAPGIEEDEQGDAYELNGTVRALDGSDYLVWQGRIFRFDGKAFVRAVDFDLPRGHANFPLTTVPSPAGFFVAAGRRLMHVDGRTGQPSTLPDVEVVAIAPFGANILLTSLGPLRLSVFDTATGKVSRLDTRSLGDHDFVLHAASPGLITMTDGGMQMARLKAD